MTRIKYILTILTVVIIQSCISSSADEIEKREEPDKVVLKKFGINTKGKILYQFYQSYGFTDKEEQLIMIVDPDKFDFLTNDLPFDSIKIKRMEYIDFRKFRTNAQINFEPDKAMFSDIQLESWEYDNGDNKKVFCGQGKYKIAKSKSLETIFLYDQKSKLLYIESKRVK